MNRSQMNRRVNSKRLTYGFSLCSIFRHSHVSVSMYRHRSVSIHLPKHHRSLLILFISVIRKEKKVFECICFKVAIGVYS